MCSTSLSTPTNMGSLKGGLDLFELERLDDVAFLDVVVALETDTALDPLANLARIVFEALEAHELARPHDHAVAHQTHIGGALDDAFAHDAARHRAHLADAEHLTHGSLAELLLDLGRREQTLHRVLHVVDDFVDDAVESNLDAVVLGSLARLARRPDVEADDDRLGGDRQIHIAL